MALFVSGKLFNKANVGEGGGGDQHNLGWYATESALTTAHPTATDGDWAIVGSTDTVWVWDTDTSAWKDSNQKAGGGIDWTGHWDMPTTESSALQLRLDCEFLPKGHYRFYYQTLNKLSVLTVEPLGYPDTYMVDFYVTENPYDQSLSTIVGVKTRVIDGTSSFANNVVLSYNEESDTVWKFDNGTKLGFSCGWTNLAEMQRQNVIENVFRWTNVVNLDTNETYPLTAYVSDVIEPSDYSESFSVTMPQQLPSPDTKTNYFLSTSYISGSSWGGIIYGVGSFSKTDKYINMYPTQGSVSVYLVCGDSVFYGTLYCADNVYYKVEKATGIFENTEFVIGDDYVWVKYNLADSNMPNATMSVYISKNGGDCLEPSFSNSDEAPQNGGFGLACYTVGSTVTYKNYGVVSQYVGETTANYTKGYFYKASGTYTTVPSTATVTVSSPSGATVSIDFDALIPAIKKYGDGISYYDIINRLSSTSFAYNEGNQIVTIIGVQFTQPEVLSCFTITGSQGQNVSGTISDLVVNEDTVTNGHWEQVDVQPGGSSLPSQTGNAGKFLVTDGTDASWGNTVRNVTFNSSNSSNVFNETFYKKSTNDERFVISYGSSGALSTHLGWSFGRDPLDTTKHMFFFENNSGGHSFVGHPILGKSDKKFENLYITTVNNGSDITVPSVGGTMVVADYTGATQGQVLTLNSSGNAEWATPSGGGSTGTTASLVVANWSSNTQTVNVTGVTASNNVIVAPAPASQADYTAAGIICTAQGAGTLTFTCTTVPSSAITVNVLII